MFSIGRDVSATQAAAKADLLEAQRQLHLWGAANRVTFDPGKEHFTVLPTMAPEGEDFKVLGLEFDAKWSMRKCVQTCVVEASWRFRSLLRTQRFFTDADLIGLFKSHVLSFCLRLSCCLHFVFDVQKSQTGPARFVLSFFFVVNSIKHKREREIEREREREKRWLQAFFSSGHLSSERIKT